MNSRHSEKMSRVDIRIPKEIYERIQTIAVSRYKAKIHHRSGKPEVSPTILELIKRGMVGLEAEVSEEEEISNAEELIEQIEELDLRLTALENKLSSGAMIITAPESSSSTEGEGLNDLELGELLGVSNLILRNYRVYGKKPRGQALAQELADHWVVKEELWIRKKLKS